MAISKAEAAFDAAAHLIPAEVLTLEVSDPWSNHREMAKTLYAKLEQHSRQVLENMLLLGNLFNSVKAGIKRGEFMPFVKSTGVPYSTANLYMNMATAARFNPALPEKASIRGMLRLMHGQRNNIAEAVDRKPEDAPVTPIDGDPIEPELRPHENILTADQIVTNDHWCKSTRHRYVKERDYAAPPMSAPLWPELAVRRCLANQPIGCGQTLNSALDGAAAARASAKKPAKHSKKSALA